MHMWFAPYALAAMATPFLPAQSLQDAETALVAHDLKTGTAILQKLAAAPGARPDDRVEAQRLLARMDWWFFAKPEAARERLLKAIDVGVGVPNLLCELGTMENKLGHTREAQAAARRAILISTKALDRRNAQLVLAEAVITEAQNALLLGKAVPDPKGLQEVAALLRDRMAEEPGVLKVAHPLLEAAMMLGDGPTAWKAWQAYFHATPGTQAPNLLQKPMAVLQEILPTWKGGVLAKDKATALVQALSDSRLFVEAAVFLRDPAHPEVLRQSFVRLLAYQDFLRMVSTLSNEYYRATAQGKGSKDDFLNRWAEELRTRWDGLGLPGTPEGRSFLELGALAYPVLETRYGTMIHFGNTAGYFDLHMGHRITDEQRTIDQYGKIAQVRYQVLDNMTSNGFQSWAWCYAMQHGGWSNGSTITNVRGDAAGSSLALFRKGVDPAERKAWDEKIAQESKEDEQRAIVNPYAFLPGLADRLERSVLDGMLVELDRKGILEPETRCLAFLAERERELEASTIFSHEGRHAIDKAMGIQDSATLEFRAKLSEIGFSQHPQMMFSQVHNQVLGDSTPHGQGSLRIVRGVMAWMETHGSEIRGFDPKRPILPQLDLLTNKQLRIAVRTMDTLPTETMKQPIGRLLLSILEKEGIQKAVTTYWHLKQDQPEVYTWGPGQLNELGYNLMERNRLDDALEIFKLYTEAYPTDVNAYDSLGEAYVAKGEKAKAIASYERALQLDSKWPSAIKALETLRR